MKEPLANSEKIHLPATRLRTGIDIVYTEDIRDLIDYPTDILLTENEWKNIKHSPNKLQRIAGRFAAKEAILKVLGQGIDKIELIDIEIINNNSGKPTVYLQNSALHYWKQIEFSELELSISHHKDYAVAIAIAIKL